MWFCSCHKIKSVPGEMDKWLEKMKEFRDQDGNIKPNSWDKDSENPTTFNVVHTFLVDLTGYADFGSVELLRKLIKNKWFTNGGKYKTNDNDNNDSFSLDESLSVAAACARFNHRENLKRLKIVTSQTWFRLYDVVPFLILCKYPWAKVFLFPQLLVSLSCIVSCLRPKMQTSGKQLAFIKCYGLEMDTTYSICNSLVDYREVFAIYYPETDHPINRLARMIWH